MDTGINVTDITIIISMSALRYFVCLQQSKVSQQQSFFKTPIPSQFDWSPHWQPENDPVLGNNLASDEQGRRCDGEGERSFLKIPFP